MNRDEYMALDGLGVGDLVRTGQVSAVEMLECAVALANAVEPRVNSLVYRFTDAARAEAAAIKPQNTPFTGVPTVLKDILGDCRGVPTRMGSSFVPAMRASRDATTVLRMKEAGFVPFAKTNVPEFGLLPFSESKLYGPVRNPWDIRRTAGGSSGGSAAAVAAGIVPVAHASDGGGSIRIPASCCGLVGLKPSRGRTSFGPAMSDPSNGLISEHVVTRSVRDSAACLDVIAGNAIGDPFRTPKPDCSFLAATHSEPGSLRIAFSTLTPRKAVLDPELAMATHATAQLCENLGHRVHEANFAIADYNLEKAYVQVHAVGLAATVDAIETATGLSPSKEDFELLTWELYRDGRATRASQYILALEHLRQVGRQFGEFFEAHDIWLTPTLGSLPLLGSAIGANNPLTSLTDPIVLDFVHYNPIYNISGQPAVSLPLHASKAGLPIGMQFGARFGDEGLLLSLAAQLELAAPWKGRRPRLYA